MADFHITKKSFAERILTGERLEKILPLTYHRNFMYYKATNFSVSEELIYVPDMRRNGGDGMTGCWDGGGNFEICMESAYTGYDFVSYCWGSEPLARELFERCDGRDLETLDKGAIRNYRKDVIGDEMAAIDRECPDIDVADDELRGKLEAHFWMSVYDLEKLCEQEGWFADVTENKNLRYTNRDYARFLAMSGDNGVDITPKTLYEMGKMVTKFTDSSVWEVGGLSGIMYKLADICTFRFWLVPGEDQDLVGDYIDTFSNNDFQKKALEKLGLSLEDVEAKLKILDRNNIKRQFKFE